MDAGFLSVVEIGQYFMTKDTGEQVYAVACREYTLPRDDGSSQTRGWIQGNTKMGPMLEVTTSCLHGKHGVEIRIWSLSEDNTHSWVRISHGSNKFVMNLNSNETEIPEDLPEEQALHLNAEEFVSQPKAKAKPRRREPAHYSPSIIPMNERNWIDIKPGNNSLSAYEVSKKEIHLLRHSQKYNEKMTERLISGESKKISRVNFHKFLIGLTIDGKHAWQQEEEQKGDISTAHIQDAILLILHCRTMW